MLFIDLDHFKHLNDRFGHAKGDRALKIIAERIRTIIRPGDTAGRLGGDEFAVLLEDVDDPGVISTICNRLLEGIIQPIELDDAAPIVSASIGYALSGTDGTTSEDLLRNADIAMYAAKAAGRGQVVAFRQELLDTAAARSELAAMLRGAESRDELQLHFQPVVNLDDGTPVGVEALLRWQPKGHLLHLPAEFLELAEETGEILPIGRWVIAEGCRRIRAWPDPVRPPGPAPVRQPVGAPVPRPGPRPDDRLRPDPDRHRARRISRSRSPRARCSRRASRPSSASASCARWASAWRSTTSGRATRRSATSTRSRSTS